MPSRFQMAIGAVKDQTSIGLARVNGSSNLQVAVLKATTHNDLDIDDRYIYEILQLISSNKTYAAACARAIGKRITRTQNWIVASKSLVLVLRILQDGDPYFPRELVHATKRGASLLKLSSFCDGSGSWDYTAFVRTFGLYLDERLDCFLTGKLQRRYAYNDIKGSNRFKKRSNDYVCDMKPAMLIDRIGYWQRLLERAIATRPTGEAKDNLLVKIALYAVLRDSFDLYRDVSDGLALILDSFLCLQYELRVRAFEICVKAEKQFEELERLYSGCKRMGIGRDSEYPTIQTISGELIKTLQEFLNDRSVSPGVSDRTSESGSECKSKLIDMEECSDQSERPRPEETFRMSRSCSTQSLPVTNSIVDDLLSSDDWPANEEQRENQEIKQGVFEPILVNESSHSTSANSQSQSTSSKDQSQFSTSKDWEVLLATHTSGNNFGTSVNRQAKGDSTTNGWELVLERIDTRRTGILSNNLDAITLYNQPQLSPIHHYNPSTQDVCDLPAVGSSTELVFWSMLFGRSKISDAHAYRLDT